MDDIIQIRKDSCVGCGICANGCPQQAISLVKGHARINQRICNQCGSCIGLCPQGAIVRLAAVSEKELATMIGSLRKQADDIVARIERLRQLQY